MYEEEERWANRESYNGKSIPVSVRSIVNGYNTTEFADNTILQRLFRGQVYYLDGMFGGTIPDSFALTDSSAVKFIDPDEYYFILCDSAVNEFDYNRVTEPGPLYSRLSEQVTGKAMVQTPGLFYSKVPNYPQYFTQGAIALNKETHEFYPNVVVPVVETNVIYNGKYSDGSALNTEFTGGISMLTDVFEVGIPYAGSYYGTMSKPPNLFSGAFYASSESAYSRLTLAIDTNRSINFSYSGSYLNNFPFSSAYDPSVAIAAKNINVYGIRSVYPNLIIIKDADELKDIISKTNDELDKLVWNENAGTPYNPGGESTIGGGGGNFGIDPSTGLPVQSDDIASSLPPTGSYEGSVANAGLFVHYAMSGNMLEVVGDWLWATDLGLIIAKEVLSILYGSPIESAISLMSYPFNVTALPGVVSNQQELYWGAHGAGFNATAITNPYATIDWGTVQLTEFWGNFLDYAPHTKLELYLPWCTGFVPIDPNECLPGSLRVVTNIELAKGTCLHNVIGNDGLVIATHGGTCGKQLPLTALDTSGKALQLVSTAAAAISAGASGIAGDAAAGAAESHYRATHQLPLFSQQGMDRYHAKIDAAKAAASAPHQAAGRRAENRALAGSSAMARTPASVQRSGSFSGASAGLGVQYPYLILSRPTQSVPAQYGHHYGYPSNIYTPLTNLRGYTEVGEIHLTGFVCTEDELMEIDSLLKGGVIL